MNFSEVQKMIKARYEVGIELEKALVKFPSFHGPHEGYAVILEELDELWEEVKAKNAQRDGSGSEQDDGAMRHEAMQVAAMAIRFMMECTQ